MLYGDGFCLFENAVDEHTGISLLDPKYVSKINQFFFFKGEPLNPNFVKHFSCENILINNELIFKLGFKYKLKHTLELNFVYPEHTSDELLRYFCTKDEKYVLDEIEKINSFITNFDITSQVTSLAQEIEIFIQEKK